MNVTNPVPVCETGLPTRFVAVSVTVPLQLVQSPPEFLKVTTTSESAEARRVWEEVVSIAVPDQKHLQEFKRYDQLGALLDQVNRLRLSAHSTREVVFEIPYTAMKLFGETGFNDWVANCKGLQTLTDLVAEVRRAGLETFREKSRRLDANSAL